MSRAAQTRAFWVVEPGRGEIRPERLDKPSADEIVVRTLYSGISRGTEALVSQGGVPATEYQRMRAPFQSGDFPAPIKYGYASVGHVEQGPRDLLDRAVFVLYPHQTRYVVPAQSAYVLPEGVPAARAVLAANLETAVNGVWDAAPQIGDRIAVIGAGTVGCLVAWLTGRGARRCQSPTSLDCKPTWRPVLRSGPSFGKRGHRDPREWLARWSGCRPPRRRIRGIGGRNELVRHRDRADRVG